MKTRRAKNSFHFLALAALAMQAFNFAGAETGVVPPKEGGDRIVTMPKMTVKGFADQVDCLAVTKDEKVVPSSKLFGIFVIGVRPNSPAEKAGIKTGMQLVSIKQKGQKENNLTGRGLTVGEAKERLRKSNLIEVDADDVERGWIELQVVLNDSREGRKTPGKFTVAIRVNIKAGAQ